MPSVTLKRERMTAIFRLTIWAFLSLLYALPAQAEGVYVLTVKGAISPAIADYLVRGITQVKLRIV